jgi:hypothetical protein
MERVARISAVVALCAIALRLTQYMQPGFWPTDPCHSLSVELVAAGERSKGELRRLFLENEAVAGECLLNQRFWSSAASSGIHYARLHHHREVNSSRPLISTNEDEVKYTNRFRLEHDIEQLEWLVANVEDAHWLKESVLPNYIEVMKDCVATTEEHNLTVGMVHLPATDLQKMAPFFGRPVHVPFTTPIRRPLLSASVRENALAIEQQYLNEGLVVIDDLLDEEVLQQLRRYCMESTIWYETKPWGYVGAYIQEGFAAPILLELAEELRTTMPAIFSEHLLSQLWVS